MSDEPNNIIQIVDEEEVEETEEEIVFSNPFDVVQHIEVMCYEIYLEVHIDLDVETIDEIDPSLICDAMTFSTEVKGLLLSFFNDLNVLKNIYSFLKKVEEDQSYLILYPLRSWHIVFSSEDMRENATRFLMFVFGQQNLNFLINLESLKNEQEE